MDGFVDLSRQQLGVILASLFLYGSLYVSVKIAVQLFVQSLSSTRIHFVLFG